ncbi:MAG: hypothetical protein UR60_C0038G0004 [Candidatus Moranbacteria bacterium GW2011_GWF2_34_56]|nr:MAG: hypothetical protein UR60_C0038G0004 [Candidatus Moranbacteria bacterium GW2011_GWF2_34_56]
MSAISIVSYVTSKRNAELETAAEELVAVLREAQNYSLTGKEVSSTCSNYRVTVINGSSNYLLRTYTAGGVACGNINSTYVFRSGVVTSSGAGYLSFAAPHASVTRTAGMVAGSFFRIALSKGGGSYYVCFNHAGLIKKTTSSSCN